MAAKKTAVSDRMNLTKRVLASEVGRGAVSTKIADRLIIRNNENM